MCRHWVDLLNGSGVVTSFLDDVDSILLTDCADYREPELFQESLCAKDNERRACAQ